MIVWKKRAREIKRTSKRKGRGLESSPVFNPSTWEAKQVDPWESEASPM